MTLVTRKDKNRIISIEFDKIFQQDISHMNDFSLTRKRNFVNIADLISEAMNYVFDRSETIALNYLTVKYKIESMQGEYEEDQFVTDVIGEVMTPDVIEIINGYVDETYKIELDQQTSTSKSVNEELQFTDDHAKIILKTSMAMKVVIPLITDYLSVNNVKKSDNFFLEVFGRLFEIFTTDDVDILNKLFKLIDSRIISTRYSDRIIWSYLKNLSIDTNILTRQFYKKVIINIIPKLENNRNIVSYLHVVLKNLIKYQFTINFPISYKPLNLNQTDSEGLSDFDKLEVNMLRADEGVSLINKLTINKNIYSLMSNFHIEISKEELDYYIKNVQINKMQTNLLFLFFSKYMGSYSNLYNCDHEEYVILCIIARKWLEGNNFPILGQFMTAVPERYTERKSINKKEFLNKLINSKKFENLLNNKYRFIIPNLVDSGVIIKIIATLSSNKFYHLVSYEEHLAGIEDSIIDEKIEAISDEFLNFLEII